MAKNRTTWLKSRGDDRALFKDYSYITTVNMALKSRFTVSLHDHCRIKICLKQLQIIYTIEKHIFARRPSTLLSK